MKPDLRRRVERRAKGRCEYCQLPLRRDPLTHHIDHVVATQHGGRTRLDNLAVTCSRCNCHKGPNLSGVDPQTQQTVPLFHPRKDRWREHFRLVGSLIEGITPRGRATVRTLAMNGSQRVKFRAKLILEGLYDAFLGHGPDD